MHLLAVRISAQLALTAYRLNKLLIIFATYANTQFRNSQLACLQICEQLNKWFSNLCIHTRTVCVSVCVMYAQTDRHCICLMSLHVCIYFLGYTCAYTVTYWMHTPDAVLVLYITLWSL